MFNLSYSHTHDIDFYILGEPEEEERKVHTPFVEPMDFTNEYSSSIKPIRELLEFTCSDIVMAKKAKSRKTKTIEDPNSNKKSGHWSSD